MNEGQLNIFQEIWKQEEEETLSIITYGMGVHWAMNASEELGMQDSIEIVDLRTLHPLDYKTVFNGAGNLVSCLSMIKCSAGSIPAGFEFFPIWI